MAEHVNGINPNILKWARERSGYTVEAIAAFLKKDASIVNDWESGERALTYVQLENVSRQIQTALSPFSFSQNLRKNLTLPRISRYAALITTLLEPRTPYTMLRQAYATATFLDGTELRHKPIGT